MMRFCGGLLALLTGSSLVGCGGDTVIGADTGGSGGNGGSATGGSAGAVASGGSGGAGSGGQAGSPAAGTGGVLPAGCNLEVLAQGTLPTTAQATRTGPDIVATDTGFAIGFREQAGPSLVAKLMLVTDAGVAAQPSVFDLGGCSAKTPSDGVALAYRSGKGLFTTSLPDCGAGAGTLFVSFNTQAVFEEATGPKNATFTDLTLASSAGLAPSATTGEYDFVYRVISGGVGAVERVVMQGPAFKNIPTVHPFGEVDLPFGMVATTGTLRAFLAPTPDKSELELQVGPNSGDTILVDGKNSLPPSSAPSMTAWDDRVAVGVSTGGAVFVRVLERSTGALTAIAESSVTAPSSMNARLAVLGDRLIVTSGDKGAITISLISGAGSSLKFDAVKSQTKTVSPSSEQIAVAAARGRIVLTWLATTAPVAPAGGWMILNCAQ